MSYIDNCKYFECGKGKWKLYEDWVTPFGTLKAGFEFNGASVPKGLQWLVKPDGILFKASIIHDWYYKNAIKTKLKADWYFFVAALDSRTPMLLAIPSLLGVVLVGRGNY